MKKVANYSIFFPQKPLLPGDERLHRPSELFATHLLRRRRLPPAPAPLRHAPGQLAAVLAAPMHYYYLLGAAPTHLPAFTRIRTFSLLIPNSTFLHVLVVEIGDPVPILARESPRFEKQNEDDRVADEEYESGADHSYGDSFEILPR